MQRTDLIVVLRSCDDDNYYFSTVEFYQRISETLLKELVRIRSEKRIKLNVKTVPSGSFGWPW